MPARPDRKTLAIAAHRFTSRHVLAAAALACTSTAWSQAASAPSGDGWTVVGRQGLLVHVIVPLAQARDREAYQREMQAVCGDRETCFINFYTNSTGAAASLPLADAISSEATAVLRRSAKQGVEGFRWSCRLALPEPDCF